MVLGGLGVALVLGAPHAASAQSQGAQAEAMFREARTLLGAGKIAEACANCITWWDAMAFCAWDGGYLPTEAEWDYAAGGGGEQRTYPWSNPPASSTIDCSYANYFIDDPESSYCVNGTTGAANRVGSESPRGDSRWGQADMAGDLHEWVLDWYRSMHPVPCINCATLTTLSQRVVRGGSFTDVSGVLEAGARSQTTPSNNSVGIGARCARTP